MLIEHVLDESLRVLTPNALMVRVTRTPTRLGAYRLPAGCEVLLSPFLSHRDVQMFPQPQRFLPSRWANSRPSPYAYFPFGAGGHGCVGRGLSLRLLRDCLVALMRRGEIVLDGDAAVDWRVHVMLMPTHDPRVRLSAGALGEAMCGGVLKGGVCDIVDFVDEDDGEYDGS
jgi:cytochrome P450